MSDTEEKVIKLILRPGVPLAILTKMPGEEIARELLDEWPQGMARLDGIDEKGAHNVTFICRADISGFIIVSPSKILSSAIKITQ